MQCPEYNTKYKTSPFRVMPLDLAGNDEVKAAFAEHVERSDITEDNKNWLLLVCARLGLASRLRAVLQAGANAAHADQVRVRAFCQGLIRE